MSEVDAGLEQILQRDPAQIPSHYRLLNWKRLRAPFCPYFLRSLMRASRVRKPCLLQPRPQLEVVLDERAGDAEAQRAGLAGDAAAGDGREHVELIGRFGQRQRLLDLGAERFGGEGLFERSCG